MELELVEAITVKSRAKALLRDARALLLDKTVPQALHDALDSVTAALRKTWSDLEGETASSTDTAPVQAAVVAAEARRWLIEVSQLSFDDRERGVWQAIKARYPSPKGGPAGMGVDGGPWVHIEDVFDNYAIYGVEDGKESKTYKVAYSVLDGKVTLGEPLEVEEITTYEPVKAKEAASALPVVEQAEVELTGDLIPLLESGPAKSETVPIKIIQPGWGSSGYYSKEVLQRDGPKVFPVGTHMFVDHPTATEESERPERSVTAIGAVLASSARWEENGSAGPGLYASAKPMPSFREKLVELAPHIGVSIRAVGKATQGEAEGRKGAIIQEITGAKSVDFVTSPGAGGRILQLWESARIIESKEVRQVTEEEAKALREANEVLQRELAELKAVQALQERKTLIAETLAASELPEAAKAKLSETLVVLAEVSKEIVDAAIVKEAEYIASVASKPEATGVVITGMGPTANGVQVSTGLKEAYKTLYRQQRMTEEQAEKMATIAAGH